MAIASLSRIESHITPPATPNPTAETKNFEPVDVGPKACLSKNCVHKKKDEDEQIAQQKKKKKSKQKKDDSDSDSSDDDSDSSEDSEDSSSDSNSASDSDAPQTKNSKTKSEKTTPKERRRRRRHGRRRRLRKTKKDTKEDKSEEQTAEAGPAMENSDDLTSVETLLKSRGINVDVQLLLSALGATAEKKADDAGQTPTPVDEETSEDESSSEEDSSKSKKKKKKVNEKSKKDKKSDKEKGKTASKAEFKRLDEIWDEDLYDYKLKETSEEKSEDEYDEYIFTVRRKFDDDGRHQKTVVYLKSEILKEVLGVVLSEVECVSLVEEVPQLDPNTLFLFLEDFKTLYADIKKQQKEATKKKERKALGAKREQLKVMIKYLEKDYDQTKRRLVPLLQSGKISFDLLWALFKPNTLAYSSTYNDDEQPRTVKIYSSYIQRSYSKGVYYEVEGRHLDYDGKMFGNAECYIEVKSFQGTRKISSLNCYPLQFHQDPEKLKARLLERGKNFLMLAGMNYRLYKGMAYVKKEDRFLKANVNGRIMIDPGTFRRINPNYPLNSVEPREFDNMDEDDDCCCQKIENKKKQRAENKERLFRLVKSGKDDAKVVEVDAADVENLEKDVDTAEKEDDLKNTFSEEELLTASAVLPGFSFSEKTWLEFAVSEVRDVTWNDGAFESLVLPEKHKSIVRALVSAHGMHSSKEIDDVIAGKGKGLVAVLHGRPGLGKTLTCEAVSDLLKRPLYTVSAGDLGTSATQLETELQSILDIAHTWGAVLLMDEADVFLEERSIHDVHRNALVSIFLRLLEYFQGILFLTTNRVETFDEAFVSRIHLSLRYGDLTTKAKRSVWKTFIDRVKAVEGMEVETISDADYVDLTKHDMNGRQIKNLVKTAQALSLHEGVPMSIRHIRKVIEVARDFEMDLKGGRGFEEAMRSYT